jgi:hypothetical protein
VNSVLGFVSMAQTVGSQVPPPSPITGEPSITWEREAFLAELRKRAGVRTFDDAVSLCRKGQHSQSLVVKGRTERSVLVSTKKVAERDILDASRLGRHQSVGPFLDKWSAELDDRRVAGRFRYALGKSSAARGFTPMIAPLASRGSGLKLDEGLGARRRIRVGLDGHTSGRSSVPWFEANVCLQR